MLSLSILRRLAITVAFVLGLAFGLDTLATHVSPLAATAALLSLMVAGQIVQSRAARGVFGAATVLSDLWTPAIWIPTLRQRVVERPSLINSGIVVRNPQFDEIASGPGIQATLPFLREPNNVDEIQVENTAPTINNISSGSHVAPIFNRVSTLGATALSGAVSGADPVGAIIDTTGDLRLRQRQRLLLAMLRGLFGYSATSGQALGALYQLRYDAFLEAGASPTSPYLIDTTKLTNSVYALGEEVDSLVMQGGAILMHSAIAAALQNQDQITFVRNSEGKLLYTAWKNIPIFYNDLLVRAGTTSGKVYDTYIIGMGAFGLGDKPQTANVGDVSSLLLDTSDAAKNNVALYDRTRFVLHMLGSKWTGTPAGQSATNVELQVATNWALAYSDYRLCRAVCLRTNG